MRDGDLEELLRVDGPAILAEMPQFEEHYARFGDRLPVELARQLATLKQRLEDS
jgi:phosphoenolpyruvate carboxykinase (GTP)